MGLLYDEPRTGGLLGIPSDDEMAKMKWKELQAMRLQMHGNQAAQLAISPYEHRAYAREEVGENPYKSILYSYMIPGYQAYKMTGIEDTDDMSTPPSLNQAVQGFIGMGEGLSSGTARVWNKYLSSSS